MNPWLQHLTAFHAQHPQNSYGENMKLARATYTPVKKTTKPTNPKGKIQKGKGPYGEEAAAISAGVQALSGVANTTVGAIQTDKKEGGRYDKARFDKKTREVARLQRLMKQGKFPKLSLEKTQEYVEECYGK